jgi:hypothetical protein
MLTIGLGMLGNSYVAIDGRVWMGFRVRPAVICKHFALSLDVG